MLRFARRVTTGGRNRAIATVIIDTRFRIATSSMPVPSFNLPIHRRGPMRLLRLAIVAMIVALCAPQVRAAGDADLAEPPRVAFHRLPLDEMLTQNSITCMLQDRSGLMWFGTLAGVNVYDGYRFRHLSNDPRDPNALGGVDVSRLMEDRDGGLWIAGSFGSIGWLDRLD